MDFNSRFADDDFESGSFANNDFGRTMDGHFVRIRGLPWTITKREIVEFFDGVSIRGGEDGIHLVTLGANSSRPSGEAYIEFNSAEDARRALSFDMKHLRTRYIEGKITFCFTEFALN